MRLRKHKRSGLHADAIIGQFLQEAVKKRGTGPVVYHPSNLGFEFPRQFRELAAIGNQVKAPTACRRRLSLRFHTHGAVVAVALPD